MSVSCVFVADGARGPTEKPLFQQKPTISFSQDAHLLNGDFIELLQELRLTHSGFNEYGIQVFHIGETISSLTEA